MIRSWLVFVFVLALWPWAALAEAPDLTGNLVQGGLAQGQVAPGTRVEFDGRAVRVDDNGRFIIGFGRDFPATAPLYWYGPDGRRQAKTLSIKGRRYKVQRIDGLPPKMVTPPPES